MKKGLVIFYFLLTNICFGQLYHAGTGEVVQPRPHWEVALGWSASSGEISLKNGSTSSNGQHGLMGRVMYIPVQSLSLGVEGIVFSDQKISPLVDKYSAQRFGILASYNLTPDTNPHVYTLVGLGATHHCFRYVPPYQEKKEHTSVFYLSAGIGLGVKIWENIFGAIEGRATYNDGRDVAQFYELSRRWEMEGKVVFGYRF